MPGVRDYGGQRWVRMDCRDTTRWVALALPQFALTAQHANENGIRDIDFERSVTRP